MSTEIQFFSDFFLFTGYARTTEDDLDEVMPSCLPLLLVDYLLAHFNECFQKKKEFP